MKDFMCFSNCEKFNRGHIILGLELRNNRYDRQFSRASWITPGSFQILAKPLVVTPIINAIGYLYTKGYKPPLFIIAINK